MNLILEIIQWTKQLLQSIFSVLKVLLMSKFQLPKFGKIKNKASILGNGPSLNESLQSDIEFIKQTDIYCVNNFASSAYFVGLKPQNYVLLDPAFFQYSPENDGRADIKKTFEAILNNTNWQMRIFIPAKNKHCYLAQELFKSKPNISVCFFNYTVVRGFSSLAHYIFRKNWGMPQCQNILGASLYLTILQKYTEIFLFGADHSWHEEIRINEHNELEMRQLHFYDIASTIKHQKVIDVRDNSVPKLYNQFLSLYKAFYSYEVLAAFAKTQGSKILNASKKSYIDTFPRVSKLN